MFFLAFFSFAYWKSMYYSVLVVHTSFKMIIPTMKKDKLVLLMLTCMVCVSALGQTSKKTLNYQAVILDPKAIDIPGTHIIGQPLNKGNVCLRFSLLNSMGGLDYEETQQITTDAYGLVNVLIGAGTQSQTGNSTSIYKSFESVVWTSNVKSLQVSVSYDGCNNFNVVSSQVLNYIPYALYAEAVDYKNVRDAPTKLSQFINDAGYLIPKDLDPVKADIKSNTSQIAMANQTIMDHKNSSDTAFLLVNQSITSLDQQVAEHNSSIARLNINLADQQNQISDTRNQISATNNQLNTQVGVLQGQINTTNSTVSNLTSGAEVVSNKSTAADLGGANPSDQLYPSQKAAKAYVDQSVSQISSSGVPDATTLAPGKIQLSGDLGGTATNPIVPQLANKANIDSPVFMGTPVLPSGTTGVTQSTGDNSTKLATTAFVTAAVGGLSSGSSGVPYSGATAPVDLGAYNLTVNGIVVGIGGGDNTNTSIGNLSMRANTGARNTAFGNSALQSNSLGNDNTAVGYFALQKNTATTNPTTYGTQNTAIGSYSLQSNTTGTGNSAVGVFSMQKNTTGYDNSAFGSSSLLTNTTGYRNTANGSYALYFNTGGFENTANGYFSLQSNTTGRGNSALGAFSLQNNTDGYDNSAFGYSSLMTNTTGYKNTAVGHNSLRDNTTGIGNTASGASSLALNTSGSDNTANGYGSLNRNTKGVRDTATGAYSLFYNTEGYENTANGAYSLRDNTTGHGNTATGHSSLLANVDGFRNTGIGFYTLANNTSGDENVSIGYGAGNAITTGNRNTIIGVSADVSSNNLFNTTVIGYNAKATQNNMIVLGNPLVNRIGGPVGWTSSSDVRIKKNIRDIHYGLSTVMQLRPVEYTLISSDLKQVGFIAQEVNKLVPEVITGTEGDLEKGDILGITYANLVAVLTKAIQEQQKQIDGLNKQVEEQGKKIDYLTTLRDAQK
jgi:uncharacterized coiled-coil protein SlyX